MIMNNIFTTLIISVNPYKPTDTEITDEQALDVALNMIHSVFNKSVFMRSFSIPVRDDTGVSTGVKPALVAYIINDLYNTHLMVGKLDNLCRDIRYNTRNHVNVVRDLKE